MAESQLEKALANAVAQFGQGMQTGQAQARENTKLMNALQSQAMTEAFQLRKAQLDDDIYRLRELETNATIEGNKERLAILRKDAESKAKLRAQQIKTMKFERNKQRDALFKETMTEAEAMWESSRGWAEKAAGTFKGLGWEEHAIPSWKSLSREEKAATTRGILNMKYPNLFPDPGAIKELPKSRHVLYHMLENAVLSTAEGAGRASVLANYGARMGAIDAKGNFLPVQPLQAPAPLPGAQAPAQKPGIELFPTSVPSNVRLREGAKTILDTAKAASTSGKSFFEEVTGKPFKLGGPLFKVERKSAEKGREPRQPIESAGPFQRAESELGRTQQEAPARDRPPGKSRVISGLRPEVLRRNRAKIEKMAPDARERAFQGDMQAIKDELDVGLMNEDDLQNALLTVRAAYQKSPSDIDQAFRNLP